MSEQYTSSINSLLKKKPYKNKFSRSNYNTIFSTQESKKYIIPLIVSKMKERKERKKNSTKSSPIPSPTSLSVVQRSNSPSGGNKNVNFRSLPRFREASERCTRACVQLDA